MFQGNAKPEPCKEGDSYNEDCNTCTCTSTGVYACTRRACYHGPQFPDTPTKAPKSKRDVNEVEASSGCDKGPSYSDGCNTCVCSGERYACTKKFCFPAPVILPHSSKETVSKRDTTTENKGCDKGQSYSDGCNTCVCQGNVYACTLRACFPTSVILPQPSKATISKRDVPTESKGCDKGESYSDGCNTCVCQGNVYACTLRACFPADIAPASQKTKRAVDKGCDKGQSYYDGCNTCVCSGGSYACTEKACIVVKGHPDTVNVEHSKKRREIEESTGKYDPPKATDQNILKFDVERCTPSEVKNQVRLLI